MEAPLSQLLLTVACVVVAAQVGGAVFGALRQPRVVGEILAGVAIGPGVLGAVVPGATEWLIPVGTRPYLDLVAQLGLIVFMLLVGLEIDGSVIRRRARFIGAVSAASVAVPFVLGILLGIVVYGGHDRLSDGQVVPFVPFVLFMGLALAITAFPVLARILQDRGLAGTPLGSVALSCAALNDVVAWLVLAVVVSLVSPASQPTWMMMLGLAGLVAFTLGALRPLLAAAQRRGLLDRVTPEARLGVLVAGALAAAWFTESIGLHVIFGPFLLGLCVPRHAATLDHLHTRIAELSTSLLLPAFFVVAGLGVDLTALGSGGFVLLAATLALAMLGKIGGTALPAVGLGMHRREALTLGTLMNTRGLTELVLLSVGASVGLLDTQLYTVLVATAVITTVSTGPLLTLLREPPRPANPVALEASQDAHREGPDLPRVSAGGRR